MALIPAQNGGGGQDDFQAVTVNYSYYNQTGTYRFSLVNTENDNPISGTTILSNETSHKTFLTPVVNFEHNTGHSFDVTYKKDVRIYNCEGTFLTSKIKGQYETVNLYNGWGTGSQMTFWFVPTN